MAPITGAISRGRSADREIRVELRNQLVGERVGDSRDTLDDREAVAHFAHDHRDRRVERVGDRREDLRAGLFLAALHLAQVAEGDTGPPRHLAQSHRLLQTEVTENIADFLTYQNHGVLLFSPTG